MIDLPTIIALLAPILLLPILDQVIRRVLVRRWPRTDAAQVPARQAFGPTEMPIPPRQSAPAADHAATADARRVA